jgi:hypothetical protein
MRFKAIFLSFTAVTTACGPSGQTEPALSNDVAATDALAMNDVTEIEPNRAEPTPETESAPGWVYDTKADEMRGGIRKLAQVSASQSLSLGFPYGETTPILNVRQDPKYGFDIFITSDGQPLCRSYQDDTVSVKFDTGPVQEWRCGEAEDGSPGILFFLNPRALITKIKGSEKMAVEVNYYDNGRQQFSFPVKGLVWK